MPDDSAPRRDCRCGSRQVGVELEGLSARVVQHDGFLRSQHVLHDCFGQTRWIRARVEATRHDIDGLVEALVADAVART